MAPPAYPPCTPDQPLAPCAYTVDLLHAHPDLLHTHLGPLHAHPGLLHAHPCVIRIINRLQAARGVGQEVLQAGTLLSPTS